MARNDLNFKLMLSYLRFKIVDETANRDVALLLHELTAWWIISLAEMTLPRQQIDQPL